MQRPRGDSDGLHALLNYAGGRCPDPTIRGDNARSSGPAHPLRREALDRRSGNIRHVTPRRPRAMAASVAPQTPEEAAALAMKDIPLTNLPQLRANLVVRARQCLPRPQTAIEGDLCLAGR